MALSRAEVLMTLNTHSLIDGCGEEQLSRLARAVQQRQVDVLALQEVNQTQGAVPASDERLCAAGCIPLEGKAPLREDNFALRLCERLRAAGEAWHFVFSAAHNSYGRFEEGVALLTRLPAGRPFAADLSGTPAMDSWKSRVACGLAIGDALYVSVHTGFWNDEEAPFSRQWDALEAALPGDGPVFVMGDLNQPAHVRGEGFDLLMARGWHDAYTQAKRRDDGFTVGGSIDGWRGVKDEPRRLDYILCSSAFSPARCEVILRGDEAVSDHCGVCVHLREEGSGE